MRDDFYSPAWADNREHLGNVLGKGVHKLAADMRGAFESLARRNYDSPWLAARARHPNRSH